MTFLYSNGVIQKAWQFFRTYILTLRRFDLFLQGSMFIVILLQSNIFLLIRRDHGGGHTPAYIEDWILVAIGGSEFLLASALSWWGRRRRNLALTAWLAAAAISSSLVLALPFGTNRSPYAELCGGEPINKSAQNTEEVYKSVRLGLFIISAIFCNLAQVSIWTHGFTYLDDHEPQNGPYFYGILICIRLSLGLSGQGWLRPSSLRDDWWHAHLSLCCLTLMFACLFTLFPQQMKEFPQEEDDAFTASYFPSLQRVTGNSVLFLQTMALSLTTIAVFGFVHYDKAYVQAKFHVQSYRQDPRTSRALSDIFRSLVIIFFIMIFRVRFSSRRADGVKACTAARVGGVVAAFVAALLAAIAGLNCDLAALHGADDLYSQPDCSQHCGCDSTRYGFSPVCGLETDTTYFSPCHAGCPGFEDLHGFMLFQNCSCGVQRAVVGACSIYACRFVFSVYQVLYTVFLAVSGASLLMQGMVIVRAVRRVDKPVAVGVSMAIVGLLADACGHMLYMVISYFTCLYHEDGRCVLHKETLWIVPAISAVVAMCGAAVSVLASRARTDHVVPTTEL